MFQYSVNEVHGHTHVHFDGDLDIDASELFEEQLLPDIADRRDITISFKDVPFVDSSGIGLLLNMVRLLQEKNTNVYISGVNADVKMIFDLLQLPDIIGEHVFREA